MFLHLRENLGAEELHITADFGTHAVQDGTVGKLPDLVMVLHFRDAAGELQKLYLDCLPVFEQNESKDWRYVASCMDNLEHAGFFKPFKRIFWCSDTGPNHFRTSNTLFYFRQFFDRTSIEVVILSFFAPYHGHSQADGHIGAISK